LAAYTSVMWASGGCWHATVLSLLQAAAALVEPLDGHPVGLDVFDEFADDQRLHGRQQSRMKAHGGGEATLHLGGDR